MDTPQNQESQNAILRILNGAEKKNSQQFEDFREVEKQERTTYPNLRYYYRYEVEGETSGFSFMMKYAFMRCPDGTSPGPEWRRVTENEQS